MKKYVVIFVLLFTACTSENGKIKTALKSHFTTQQSIGYHYVDHFLMETILNINLLDSIADIKSQIDNVSMKIRPDSTYLLSIQENIKDCKTKRANTLYYLRHLYDDLIDDLKEREKEILYSISKNKTSRDSLNGKVKFFESYITSPDVTVAFYVVKHTYELNGMLKEDVILIDNNYNVINF